MPGHTALQIRNDLQLLLLVFLSVKLPVNQTIGVFNEVAVHSSQGEAADQDTDTVVVLDKVVAEGTPLGQVVALDTERNNNQVEGNQRRQQERRQSLQAASNCHSRMGRTLALAWVGIAPLGRVLLLRRRQVFPLAVLWFVAGRLVELSLEQK